MESFFDLLLIKDLETEGRLEEIDNILERRYNTFNRLLEIEAYLHEEEHINLSDIGKLKVYERRFYVNRVNERNKS